MFFELRRQRLVEEYLGYFPRPRLFDSYRLELYKITNELITFILIVLLERIHGTDKMIHKEIDFEFKPLVSDLHNMYLTEKIITTKQRVVRYFNALDTAKILFVINYKKRKNFANEVNVNEVNVNEVNVNEVNVNEVNVNEVNGNTE